jgi:hypothetical protein
LLLQQGLTESLAGRFETTYMGHWSLLEMEQAFGWTSDQYVWFGGYPCSAPLIGEEQRWKAYVQQALIETSSPAGGDKASEALSLLHRHA